MAAAPPDGGDPVADACAEQRREVAARCAGARAAAQTHLVASDRTRMLRRDLVTANHRAAAALGDADPAQRHAEKERVRDAYLTAREAATTEAERRQATAVWADALDRINRTARLADRALAKARADVGTLERSLREAERAEQTTRIRAEAAEADCLEARVRLAACEERVSGVASIPDATSTPRETSNPGAAAGASAAVPGLVPVAPDSGGPASRPVQISDAPRAEPLVIESMVSGDARALELAAVTVAELGHISPAGIRAQLQELVDAIASAAGRAGYLLFDERHPFWSRLSVSEAHDVSDALARLGFRFEPAEGWHAGRAPTPADLAMALAYAGLDTRHVRGLPSSKELHDLPASMAVDARAFLASRAPDLAMDQLVGLLGSRATRLGALWDVWGLVRPVLLSPRRALGSLPG